MGCFEVSLGDTIGSGTPQKTRNLLNHFSDIDISKIAAHFHDTGNLALENLLIALEYGISVMDSSVGGLGGCPYAQKVVGNVCTENVEKPPTDFVNDAPKEENLLYGTRDESNDMGLSLIHI